MARETFPSLCSKPRLTVHTYFSRSNVFRRSLPVAQLEGVGLGINRGPWIAWDWGRRRQKQNGAAVESGEGSTLDPIGRHHLDRENLESNLRSRTRPFSVSVSESLTEGNWGPCSAREHQNGGCFCHCELFEFQI